MVFRCEASESCMAFSNVFYDVSGKLRQLWLPMTLFEYRARYVYISRRYSHRRPMANEVEVEELMASLGFSIVYAERLSFEEKAMLMHHTSVLVGAFGAGLSCILMCHPNTTVVEIFTDRYFIDMFFYPVFVLGQHNFYPLYCDQTLNGVEMNIDKLKRVITAILEGQ